MSASRAVVQLCSRQNRVLILLDRLQLIAQDLSTQVRETPSPRIKNLSNQYNRLQKHLHKEIDQFVKHVNSHKVRSNIGSRLDHVIAEAQQLSQQIAIKYRDLNLNREEWGPYYASLAEKVTQLKEHLGAIDFKQTFAHVTDAFLVERFDSLGQQHEIQWSRKLWHMMAGFSIISIYLFSLGTFFAKMAIFGSFTLYALICDVARLVSPKFNAMVMRDLKKFMRKNEATRLNSMTFYAVSTFLVCLIFPKGIAVLSILFLAIGDVVASIVGVKWGRHKIGKRLSLEGSLAFFVTAFCLSFLYPILVPTFTGPIVLFAFLAGFIAMASEWVTFRLDDNLVIPIFSATGMQLVIWLFEMF